MKTRRKEAEMACRIVKIIEEDPDINLCWLRRFCEGILDIQEPEPMAYDPASCESAPLRGRII